jgi:hypothetical protein
VKRALLALLAALPASAHVISMSTGWATVNGNQVEYILRMPKYEIGNKPDPSRAIFDNIRFFSGFEAGVAIGEECHDDPASANYLCAATYRFRAPVERLGVECSYYRVTAPNHIHLLHAERDGKSDQAILDAAFSSATLAFRPPTAFEIFVEQSGSGAFRTWTNWAQMLLLATIALASRGRREALLLGAAFIFGECVATPFIIRAGWQPSPRFAEAAAALALAYLAFEILAFPASRGRWLLALLFGAFQGMYFAVFVSDAGYCQPYVLGGAAFAAASVLALWSLLGRIRPWRRGSTVFKTTARLLCAAGLAWFIVRLRG